MAAAPASLSTSLQEMLPESRSGKMSVLARPATALRRRLPRTHLLNDRSVRLQLSVGGERGRSRFQRFRRLGHFSRSGVIGASLRREREKRHLRLDVEKAPGVRGREERDLRELGRRRLRNDGAIREEVLTPLVGKAHEEKTRDLLDTVHRPEHAKGRPQHVGGAVRGAGDVSGGLSRFDHEGAEIEGVERLFSGFVLGKSTMPAEPVERLAVMVRPGARRMNLQPFNGLFGDSGGAGGLADDVRVTHQNRIGDLAGFQLERRPERARLGRFREHDAQPAGPGAFLELLEKAIRHRRRG